MNPTEFRRHLHAHPELSFKEHDTAAFIADRLTELGIEHRPIARTGVLAWIEGRGKADPKRRAVVLRADIDALPITEQNDIGWRSCTPGVMHACGHDMHAAMLLGAAKLLREYQGELNGTVKLVFSAGRGRLYRREGHALGGRAERPGTAGRLLRCTSIRARRPDWFCADAARLWRAARCSALR